MKRWGAGNKGASKHACSINEDLLIRSISNLNELWIFHLPEKTLLWQSSFDDAIEKNSSIARIEFLELLPY